MLIATTAVLEILVTFLGSLVAGFLGAPSGLVLGTLRLPLLLLVLDSAAAVAPPPRRLEPPAGTRRSRRLAGRRLDGAGVHRRRGRRRSLERRATRARPARRRCGRRRLAGRRPPGSSVRRAAARRASHCPAATLGFAIGVVGVALASSWERSASRRRRFACHRRGAGTRGRAGIDAADHAATIGWRP